MAELADAYGSGPYVRKDMQVQVLLSAFKKTLGFAESLFSYYSIVLLIVILNSDLTALAVESHAKNLSFSLRSSPAVH